MTPGALALLVALGSRPALPSDGGIPAESPDLRIGSAMSVVLLDGERLEGTFAGFEGQAVRLSGPRGLEPIPLPLVAAFEVGGRSWTPAAFLEGARRAADALPPLAVPPPVVPLAASLAWAGAGHLVLRDTRSFVAYASLDAILVGAGTVFAVQRQWGALAPVVVLDLVLRGWAGGASAREAARRRALRRVQSALPAIPPATPPAAADPPPPPDSTEGPGASEPAGDSPSGLDR